MTKEELKTFREQKGFTQAQFAQYLGLKREKTISEWENGKVAPLPDWLVNRLAFEKQFTG